MQVAANLTLGLSDRQIAGRLQLTLHTVRSYVRELYGRLELQNRAQVAHVVIASLVGSDSLGSAAEAATSPWARRLGLPPRLARVAATISYGASDKQAAIRLGLRAETLRTYVKLLYRQLGVHTRAELAIALHGATAGSREAGLLARLT